MINDFKPNQGSSVKQDENVALLKYKLESCRKENRKSVLIASLIVFIVAFAAGFILSDFDHSEVNALRNSNLQLREEIQELKLEVETQSIQNQNQ